MNFFKFKDVNNNIYIINIVDNKCEITACLKSMLGIMHTWISFEYTDKLLINNLQWKEKYLSEDAINYINKLIKNKAFL